MEGYDLNLNYPITTILRVSPLAELDRETLFELYLLSVIETYSLLGAIEIDLRSEQH